MHFLCDSEDNVSIIITSQWSGIKSPHTRAPKVCVLLNSLPGIAPTVCVPLSQYSTYSVCVIFESLPSKAPTVCTTGVFT